MAKQKNVELVAPEITREFKSIYGDKRRYIQVIINFLSNSLKFSSQGSKIVLHLEIL